jgi:hypothetical protein
MMHLNQTPSEVTAGSRRTFSQVAGRSVKIVVQLVIGFWLGAVSAAFLPDMHPRPMAAPVTLPRFLAEATLLIIIATFVTITFHEVGHLGAGILARFRFVLMIVGPLLITRQEDGLCLGYSGKAFFLGGAVSAPTDDVHLRRRLALMVVGGPLATALLLALAYLLMCALRDIPIPARLAGGLAVLVLSSGFMLGVSIWPARVQGLTTDGAKLLTLLKGGPEAERMTAVFAMTGVSAAGQRPRDRNPVWLQRAVACTDDSYEEAAAYYYVYFQALDVGEPERAAAYLDRTLSLWRNTSPLMRVHHFLEAAYFEGRYGRNGATARAWLELAGKGGFLVEEQTRLRAEAAVLLAEGEPEAARDRASQGLAAMERSYDKGTALAEADWLNEIVSLSDTEAAPPVSTV